MLVLGLPRGGVPVAYEVARMLNAPLDVMLVRKIGMPGWPELAIGAIASGNIMVHKPPLGEEIPAETFNRLVKSNVASSSVESKSIEEADGRSS